MRDEKGNPVSLENIFNTFYPEEELKIGQELEDHVKSK